jgi:hypothetical protein
MLAKTDVLKDTVATVVPSPEGPGEPPLPPLEEAERQPRRRKKSNLRYLRQSISEDGIDWIETIAVARPGYRIVQVKRRVALDDGRRQLIVVCQRIRRPAISKKGNGNNG